MPPRPGDRVVVRYLVSSGAATDVIGRLIDDGDPLIVERDGAGQTIPREAVVAFKTVPPRPVRASEVRSLDLARARSWLSAEHEWIDGWLCRAAPAATGNRANCAAPLHPDASLDELDGPRAWFAARGLPLRLTISDRPLPGARNLVPVVQPTSVLTVSATGLVDGGGHEVHFADSPGGLWLALTGTAAALVGSVDGAVHYASITGPAGDPIAGARLTVTKDAAGSLWGGIGSMSVAPEHRRQGLASRLVRALVARADAEGAERVFLEVMDDNAPALKLYRGMGFTRHHGYHYWSETS